MSGWRVSERSAPGKTTEAPWSPPIASSAMRALSGMDRLWRRWRGRRQLSQMGSMHGGDHNRSVAADKPVLAPFHRLARRSRLAAAEVFLQRLQRGKGVFAGIFEPWAGRIRARPYADRGRCPGSEIRSPARRDPSCRRPAVPAARRRPACVCGRFLARPAAPAGRREVKVDRLLDRALDRLERHHAGLPDAGAHLAGDVHPGALAGQVEDRRKPRQIAHIRRVRRARRGLAAGASIAICRPVSGISSTATGTLQGLPFSSFNQALNL